MHVGMIKLVEHAVTNLKKMHLDLLIFFDPYSSCLSRVSIIVGVILQHLLDGLAVNLPTQRSQANTWPSRGRATG